MKYAFNTVSCAILLCTTLFWGCAGPVDESAPDYAEFESVWQYLKVFSIYQDRIPEDPFSFSSPEDLLASVADTLKGNDYTCYYYSTVPGVTTINLARSTPSLVASGREIVTFDSLTDSTALISIASFDYGVTFNQFMALLPRVHRFTNIIIDLRFNPGGEIVEATDIIDAFLPVNTSYIMAHEREYQEGKSVVDTAIWHPWKTNEVARVELREKKVVVLFDSGSASASEILIAALKDCAGATLVGTRSYGKGMGQIRLQRRDRKILQITFLQLKGLDGGSIGEYHRIGIEPDIPASGSDEEWLLTAVQVHEPRVTSLRPLRKRTPRTTACEPAGYRVVYEE